MKKLNRRQFTYLGGAVGAAAVLQACGAGTTTAPTAAPAAPTAEPATMIAEPIQQATATTAPAADATAAPTGSVPPKPTPPAEPVEIEFAISRAEGDHYVLSAQENTKHFNEVYTNVKVNITTGVQQEAMQLRLQEHKPAEIGNTGGSATNIAGSIAAIRAGYIYDLAEPMQQESWDVPGTSWQDTINPLVQPLLEVPGHPGIWSLPNNVTTINFYYNKSIFEQAGVTPPTTWGELDAVAKAVKDAGIAPFTIDGTSADGYMSWWFDELVSKMAGNQLHRDALLGKTTMAEHPEFLAAAQTIRDFIDKEYFISGYAGLDFTGSQMVFYQGQAAMLLVGSWLLGEMKQAIPDDFQQDIFRFPMVEGGKGDPKHIFGTCNTYGIAREAPHPEIGTEWARCYNSLAMTNYRAREHGHQPAILGAESPTQTPTLNKVFEESTSMDIYNNFDLLSQMAEHQTTNFDLTGKLFRKELDPEAYIAEMDSNIADFHAKNA